MRRFLLTRLCGAAMVSIGVISVVFMLLHLIPGDPVEAMLGESVAHADVEALRNTLGLNRPLVQQWSEYLSKVAVGDLGQSLQSHAPIAQLLLQRLGATVALAVAALLISICIGLPLGIVAAQHDGGWSDRIALFFSSVVLAMPSFWLGPLLIVLFSIALGWLPVSGRGEPYAWVLPALTLGLGMAAALARVVRASLRQVLHEDYLRTARAAGLPAWRVILKHALLNAALPILTVLGLQMGGVLAGAIITETIFQWPGLGLLTVESILRRDYPVVQACVLVISLFYVLANTLTDILCGYIDPRVRMS
ncbi:MAG: ABC transporter permease [Gammaproteobacteria bacterium]